MTTFAELEAEAAELYPLGDRVQANLMAHRQRHSHIEAKTVSAEQLETATRIHWQKTKHFWAPQWDDLNDRQKRDVRNHMAIAFRAVGFYVEGDDRD